MKKTVLVVLGIVATAIVVVIAQPQKAQPEKTANQSSPRPTLSVTTIKPSLRDLPLSLVANGSVAAWQEAIIGAEISGLRLADIRVQVGDVVKKGQVLATFATDSVASELAQSRAAVAEAEATAADARLNADRARRVSHAGGLSAQQEAQYLTTEKTTQAKLELAKAQLNTQQVRYRYTQVVASDDGVISSRTATLGAVASSGQELFRLIRQNRLEWRAEVTAADLPLLKPGVAVNLTVPGFNTVTGSVRTVAPTVDMQSRNALVYVDLPAAAAQGLRPGMFGRGEFQLGVRAGLVVPQNALSMRDGFSYLFRLQTPINDTTRVTQLKVKTGRMMQDQVEIVEGIQPEDQLVATGASFLSDGDTVKVLQP